MHILFIMLIIYVNVAYVEHSFSKLKLILIKFYLQSTMSQQRLNWLALLLFIFLVQISFVIY